MNSTLTLASALYVLIIGLVALLPQAQLAQPAGRTRLLLGALCGAASLVLAADPQTVALGIGPINPSLVASAAFLWGFGGGAAAVLMALAGLALVPGVDWPLASLLAAASALLGALGWLALHRISRVPVWLGVLALATLLPLLLAGTAALWDSAPPSLESSGSQALGVVVLCGGVALLRSRARSLLALHRREDDLVSALRATGGGRWEWDVRGQQLGYAGRLYRRFGLRDTPDDGSSALARLSLGSRAGRRWSREHHHPEDRRRLRAYLRSVLAGHEATVQAEFRMLDDLGRWRWMLTRGHITQRDARGRVLRLAGMVLDITEQRELREALRASEVKYSIIYRTLPDAAGVTLLADGRYLDVNPAFERLVGLPRAQIVGRTSLELGVWAVPSERQRVLDALQRQGEARGLPVTVRSGADSVKGLMSARSEHIDGQHCMVFVFHDQSQELRVREELLASNSLLRQAGRMARLGAWEDAHDLDTLYWSEACYDLHGLPPSAPLPRNYVQAFVLPEWQETIRQHMRECVREARPWHQEMQIRRADGVHLWVRAHAEPVLEDGRVVRVRGVIQDIDDVRRATDQLRASEERMAKLFHLLPSPLGFSRRSDGLFLDVNPAWERLTGHAREQAIGQTSTGLGILTAAERQTLLRALDESGGELRAHELDITTAAGQQRTVLQSVSPLELRGEGCWLFTLLDITERQRAEQHVREREELLSLTISAASLGLWDWDLASGTITGDARWRELLGLAPAPAPRAEPWTQVLAHTDPAAIAAELSRHLSEPWLPFDVTSQAPNAPQGQPVRWVRSLGKVVAWSAMGEPRRMVGMTMDVTSQRTQAQQLERMAHYDALTGLPNRVLLERRLREGMRQTTARQDRLGVGYLDLDGFKPVNDRLGHAVGDRLLMQVAERLQRALRSGDTVARLGGDEFVILLPGLANAQECELRLRAVMASVAAPYPLGRERAVVTASIGYTLYPDDGADADTLLRHADQAMYVAKQSGRNRYHAFDAAHERAQQERRAQCERLKQALECAELALYLQPKVDMRQGVVVGAEALVRWEHPQRGVLAPGHFLPLLDGHSELQALFGEWVVDTALELIGTLMHQGLHLPVSINITPEHLQREGFAHWLLSRLAQHPQIPARLLELELTESAALYDIEHAARELTALRERGVGVSFDDFGTGYSSLTYLRRLPMSHLKLDRSFVAGMLDDAGDRAIVRGVIGLGRSFGCETIAEGVETVEQGSALLHMGCTLAQGYCIARPMPAHDFPAWVRQWQVPQQWRGSQQQELAATDWD
ncbi:hypothetical protein GCM10027019_00310 [Melaminivora jejuensis]|uniref:sensor domain-containing protein n=1 Tax=Melaminivora jejuensis TaxID=1267217 RepID=UPI001ADF1B02|nr:bifunctional diguanylate cyclase/phosphodiesterase [Melaminivora jejuensis]UHJ63642.1 EAL domain-containing protein [Melaminivora jejuensis]